MSRQFAGTGGGNQGVEIPIAASVHNLSAFGIIYWFYSPDNSGGSDYAAIYGDGASYPITLDIQMKQTGAINFFHRDSSVVSVNILSSSSGFDDGKWHWFAMLRRGATDYEMYIDGVSQGTASTNVGGGTVAWVRVGNPGGSNVLPNGGRIAHFITVPSSITIGEAKTLAYGLMCRKTRLYMPLGWGSPELDLSGNGYDGVVTGTSIGEHAPVASDYRIKSALLYAVAAGGAQLQAAINSTAAAAVSLTTTISMAASAVGSAVVSAALTTSIILGSAINASASAASNLTTSINLDAAVALSATQASSLTTQIEMVCAVSAQATVAGELAVGLNLDAAVMGSAAATGIIATQISLAASIAASSVTASQLTTGISLVAIVGGQAGSTAELATDITLSADANAAASVLGILNAQKIFNVVRLFADFQADAAKSAQFGVTRKNRVLFTRNRMKEVWF